MKLIAGKLEKMLSQYLPLLDTLAEPEISYKPSPAKWSKKEIIGHLADSAQNNIRRFIVSQYEDNPHIVYRQDEWVRIGGYRHYEIKELVAFWRLLNQHIVVLLKNMPDEVAARSCLSENTHTLEWLAKDYLLHLQHHLHQVLDLEPVAYP